MSAVLAEEVERVPIVALSAVADLVRGVSYPKTDAREEPAPGFVPVLRATNIQEADLVLDSDLVFVAERNVSSDQLLRPGDIVVATSSGSKHLVGKSGQLHAPWRGSFGAFCATVRPRPGIHPRYLALFLQAPAYWHQVTKKALGVNINNLRRGDLESLELPLPSLTVQASIVAELEKQFSRLDEAVANLKRGKANLKRYRSVVLKAAVEGRLALGGSDARSASGAWDWVTCGDVVESIHAGASFKCLERPPSTGEVGVVKVSAVTWGEFDENESKTCLSPERVRPELFIKPGDFLFSRANTIELVGACVIAQAFTKSLMLSDKILRFRFSTRVSPEWMLICLRSKLGRSEIERLATGNQESMRNIGQDRIRQIRLPLPAIAEQRRIVAEVDRRLSIVREVEAEVDANLKRAQALRQAVLARAFGGPVDPRQNPQPTARIC